jgi:pimeloyl-ACP methyl ester carboxylesterase
VLVEPGAPPAPTGADPWSDLGLQLDHLSARPEHPVLPDLAAAAARLRQQIPALTEAQALRTAERLTAPADGGLRWRWDARLRLRTLLHPRVQGFGRADYLALLARVSAELPVGSLFGDASDFNRPADRDAQLAVLPRDRAHVVHGGHFLHLETPGEVARLILAAADATPAKT